MTSERDLLDFVAREMSSGQLRLSQTDPDAAARFNAFVSQQAADYEAQTGEPRENAFKSLFDRTVGRGIGAVGRGALGVGRFTAEGFAPQLRSFEPVLSDPNIVAPTLGALDAYSKTSGGIAAESLAPLVSGEAYGQGPNAFDAFVAELQASREGQSVLDALRMRANEQAFRQTEFAPGVAPALEIGGDLTNLIPGAAVARGVGLAGRAAPRVAGEAAQSVATTGARPVVTAAQRGEAVAAQSAAREATRQVVPFGPNRTTEGVPGGIPSGAGTNLNDPEEVYQRIEAITNELEHRGRSLIRPPEPWARRMNNAQLEALARHEGLDPARMDWWDGIDPVVVREVMEGGQPANIKTIPELQRERNMLRRTLQDLEAQPVPAGAAEDVVELDLSTGRVTPTGPGVNVQTRPAAQAGFGGEFGPAQVTGPSERTLVERQMRQGQLSETASAEGNRIAQERAAARSGGIPAGAAEPDDADRLRDMFRVGSGISDNYWAAMQDSVRRTGDVMEQSRRSYEGQIFRKLVDSGIEPNEAIDRTVAAFKAYGRLPNTSDEAREVYNAALGTQPSAPTRPAGAAGPEDVTPPAVPEPPAATVETPAAANPVDELEAEVAAVRNRLSQAGVPPRAKSPPRRPLTPEEELEAEVSALRGGSPPPGSGAGGATAGGQPPQGTRRVIDLLRVSKRLRPTVEEEIAAQRAEGVRLGRERAGQATTPLARSRAFLSGQAGRTTSQKRFEPVAQRIGDEGGNLPDLTPTQASEALGVTGDDFNGMFQQIETVMGRGREFDAVDAQAGLVRLLLGNTATPRQAKLLEQVFGREMAEVARARTPLSALRKAGEVAFDVGFLLPKALRSSIDASALLRQAVIYNITYRPSRLKISAESIADMIRVGFARPGEAEKTARDIYQRITNPATNKWARQLYQTGPEKTRLYLQNPDKPVLDFAKREEAFASELSSLMPSLGKDFRTIRGHAVPAPVQAAVKVATLPVRLAGSGVRRSELMFATYLNEVRNSIATRVLDNWQREAARSGRQITQAELQELRRGINIFTGRGELGPLEGSAKFLSAAFWSPRLWAARIEAPLFPVRGLLDPSLRRASAELAKDLVAFTVTGTTILYLIDRTGLAEVETDSRSPNFGKIRVGNRTFDFWGGFQQQARYVTQLITGQRKTITGDSAGEITEVLPKDVAFNLIRSKLSPGIPTLLGNEAAGRTYEQEPIRQLSKERQKQVARGQVDSPAEIRLNSLAEQFVPLFTVDLQEAVREEGVGGGILTLPEALGVGVQTFEEGELETAGR